MFQTILLATTIVSLPALFAGLIVSSKPLANKSSINYLISFSAGTLLGGALFHLLPEGVEMLDPTTFSLIFAITIIAILVLEKFIHWHHCGLAHDEEHMHEHREVSVTYLSLIGDIFHNFLDGLIIAGAFIANPALGVSTTIAVAVHEIPQEISDISIMIRGGFSRKKAIVANIIVALSAIAGGMIGWLYINSIDGLRGYLFPVAAGMFLYIALTDLLPEIRNENRPVRFGTYALLAALGLLLMWWLATLE
ncbi:MAG: ZIP family metal transporter [Candidatus Dojkabacteria bacterium]|nr:MAG: ZIP family metal transporter [Candidatus Dojkabacteria bacterium]